MPLLISFGLEVFIMINLIGLKNTDLLFYDYKQWVNFFLTSLYDTYWRKHNYTHVAH